MKILVTSGPTREYLDRVRFMSNPATGLMGDAVAREARARGHEVFLVRGPCGALVPPEDVQTVHVETTDEMRRACLEHWGRMDAVVMAASPCDYRPSERHPTKIKRLAGEKVILSLVRTPDILWEMSLQRRSAQRMVGFAIDVENPEQNARDKLTRKSLDLIVQMPPENFSRDSGSTATIYGRDGKLAELRGNKRELAKGVIEALERLAT